MNEFENGSEQARAATRLGELRSVEAPALIEAAEALNQTDGYSSAWAVEPPTFDIVYLRRFSGDYDPLTYIDAVNRIASAKPKLAQPRLNTYLSDEREFVRAAVAWTLFGGTDRVRDHVLPIRIDHFGRFRPK